MLKNILIGILGAVVVVAVAASAYTAFASPSNSAPSSLGAANGDPVIGQANGDNAAQSNGQGGNGYGAQGNGGQGNGQAANSGTPQVLAQNNISGATTVHGMVVSVDLNGLSITLDDGTPLFVQLGQSRYNQSIGFAPQVGEGVTVYGFTGDEGLFTAITVTLDSTGRVYTFRDTLGRPMWAGGNGKGNGGSH
ncbi:MAG: hypothetical protein AB1564_11640 [Chloroflexota bacterium]